jgi:hypothetical protein
MFKKILYVGAGEDVAPLEMFPTTDFVLIDSLPRNSYGYPYYYRRFYDKDFKQRVEDGLHKLNFYKTDTRQFTDEYSEISIPDLDSHRVTYVRHIIDDKIDIKNKKSKQCVDYYFSTGIPENNWNDEMIHNIAECDAILIEGHHPDYEILRYIKKPFHFIGESTTYFPENRVCTDPNDYNYDYNAVIYHFRPEDVASYSCLSKLSKEVKTFTTYKEFYDYYTYTKDRDE